MTAEFVCVSVSLTPPCYCVGAPNILLFSHKWRVGMAHGRHGVYSCQDNSQAAAAAAEGLEFDLHTWAEFAAVMVDRKRLWLHFFETHMVSPVFFVFLLFCFFVCVPRSCAWSRNLWCRVCGEITQIEWNMQLQQDTWRDLLLEKETVIIFMWDPA